MPNELTIPLLATAKHSPRGEPRHPRPAPPSPHLPRVPVQPPGMGCCSPLFAPHARELLSAPQLCGSTGAWSTSIPVQDPTKSSPLAGGSLGNATPRAFSPPAPSPPPVSFGGTVTRQPRVREQRLRDWTCVSSERKIPSRGRMGRCGVRVRAVQHRLFVARGVRDKRGPERSSCCWVGCRDGVPGWEGDGHTGMQEQGREGCREYAKSCRAARRI